MARIFITGSADGLGQLAAISLIAEGHKVLLHARNEVRGNEAFKKVPGAEGVVLADLSKPDETIKLGEKVNAFGNFDAVIHNAGAYQSSGAILFAVNTLAPYILTCLINQPKRLIYLTSGMNEGGHAKLDMFKKDVNRIRYSDTKLHIVMLCKAIARNWPEVYANAVNPGWVPTKMGGAGAPDTLEDGYETQTWLAVSDDVKAKVSGHFFYHKAEANYNREADDEKLQEQFISLCEELTGVRFPVSTNSSKI